jgi:glycosyltransferase involved in cell wall biosynthesis
VHFLIAGDGRLCDEIEKSLIKDNLKDKVTLIRWIDHGNVRDSLNKLKLVVILSLTEGLPNSMLEAMACGTSVLAAAVGAITDGETGFIIEKLARFLRSFSIGKPSSTATGASWGLCV